MTKQITEGSKTKKPANKDMDSSKLDKTAASEEERVSKEVIDEVDEEGLHSSEEGDSGSEIDDEESSGDNAEEILSGALDTITKQAMEHEVVIPPVVSGEKQEETIGLVKSGNQGIVSKESDNREVEEDSSSEESASILKAPKRKLEDTNKIKKQKLSRTRRSKLKAEVTDQVVALASKKLQDQGRIGQTEKENRIPKQSPNRIRQKKAVEQAQKHLSLSSRYEKLAKLLELNRQLTNGNPFKLIDPKQVYPHFYEIPGINSIHMQPLVRLWQEKATKILYQLLVVETKCDIARLKRRTMYLKADSTFFAEIFQLKIDIGLERDPALEVLEARNREQKSQNQDEAGTSKGKSVAPRAVGPPSAKKPRKTVNIDKLKTINIIDTLFKDLSVKT